MVVSGNNCPRTSRWASRAAWERTACCSSQFLPVRKSDKLVARQGSSVDVARRFPSNKRPPSKPLSLSGGMSGLLYPTVTLTTPVDEVRQHAQKEPPTAYRNRVVCSILETPAAWEVAVSGEDSSLYRPVGAGASKEQYCLVPPELEANQQELSYDVLSVASQLFHSFVRSACKVIYLRGRKEELWCELLSCWNSEVVAPCYGLTTDFDKNVPSCLVDNPAEPGVFRWQTGQAFQSTVESSSQQVVLLVPRAMVQPPQELDLFGAAL